jgi:hypothetical protein
MVGQKNQALPHPLPENRKLRSKWAADIGRLSIAQIFGNQIWQLVNVTMLISTIILH